MNNRQISLTDDDVKDHLHTVVFIPSTKRFCNRQAAPEFIKKNLQIRMLNYNPQASDSMSGFTVMMEDITICFEQG